MAKFDSRKQIRGLADAALKIAQTVFNSCISNPPFSTCSTVPIATF